MNIALFGGSFDPPHLAHLQIAEFLLQQRGFDEVWVVPSGAHPFKKCHASFEDRTTMCRLAFASLGDRVKVLEVERELSGYTIDLVCRLEKEFPEHRFTFVLGSDLKEQLQSWRGVDELKKKIDFEFLPRPPLASPFSDISSTEIRGRLQAASKIEDVVSPEVESYIRHRKLYR